MSAPKRVFADTNILVYAHDRSAGAKHKIASSALAQFWQERRLVISVQVLQELHVVLTRKSKLSTAEVRELLQVYGRLVIADTKPEMVIRASVISEKSKVSFLDAMILSAAEASQAEELWTEDLNHGQVIAGIKVVNPFQG